MDREPALGVHGQPGGVSAGNRAITNVVMMGMGEPLLNFDAVIPRDAPDARRQRLRPVAPARDALAPPAWCPASDRLRERCPVALAVSLHAPNDELRDRMVPINRKYPIRELLAACRATSSARRATSSPSST